MVLNAEPTPATLPNRERTSRGRRWVARGALSAIAVTVVVAAVLAWQATQSSISLGFLRGRVEAELRARLPDAADIAIGSIVFSYRGDRGIVLGARDVRLDLPGMATVEAAELATVTTPAAIFGRRIDLGSVTATGLTIGVALPAVAMAEAEGSGADRLRLAASTFMGAILAADDMIRRTGLKEIAVRDSALHIMEGPGARGPALNIAEANWLPLGAGRSKVWMQVVEADGAGWDLTLERRRGRLGTASVSVEVEDLPVAALAPALDGLDNGPHFRSAITLRMRIAAGRDGRLTDLHGALSIGSGELSVNGNDRIRIVNAALTFELGGAGDRLAIRSGEIRTETGGLTFEGVADLREPAAATLVARVRGGALPSPLAEQPIVLTGGGVVARLDFPNRTLEVDRVHLLTREGTVSAIGHASLGGPTPGLSLALSFSEMPVAVVRAFWPPFVAAKTRRWVDANLKSGTIGPASLQVALPPDALGRSGRDKVLPANALTGSTRFRDAEFLPLRSLPVVRQATGEITFGNATATVRVASGVIVLHGRGELQAGGTALAIPELGKPRPYGDLHLELSGPAAALAALSDMPPLIIAAKRGVHADALSGEAHLSLDAAIPLFDGKLEEVSPLFRLALTDFTSTSPIAERQIADADLVLEGSPQSFTVKGEGTLDGMQASVDINLGSGATGPTAVTLALDEAARERLGLGLGGLVTGPVEASLQEAANGGRAVALDLTEARIRLPFLGWEKGAGVLASARFVLEKSEEATRIAELVIAGEGFGVEGELTIDADGALRDLHLTKFALRPGDRLSLTARAEGGGYEVDLRGASLDARALLRGIGEGLGGDAAGAVPIHLSLDIDKLVGHNDTMVADLSGSMTVTKKGLDAVALEGTTPSGGRFEWTVGRDGKARVLRVFADDGGALLRFAGIYGKIAGGSLIIDYGGPVGGAGSGVAVMRDFRILGETALAPALQRGSQLGYDADAGGGAETAASGDLSFEQLRVPFRQEGWVLSIEDAALRGGMLGATGSGTINIPGKRLAISGTFIPAFGINNIAGSIPILGGILGGGRDEGLVGITYKLFGPLHAPELAMNPISAIAPGIFRRIFEYN